MEKIISILTGADGDRLLAGTDSLTAAGATKIQINVVDDAVTPADGQRMVHAAPAPNAFVSLWLPTVHAPTREPVDVAVRAAAGDGARPTAYLVTESCPLDADATHPVELGHRTPGFAQIALLRRPADQSHGDFLAAWLDHHPRTPPRDQTIARPMTNLYR